MNRRRFLESIGLTIGALLISRNAQLFAGEALSACSYALAPVESVLSSYVPPQGLLGPDRDGTIEFDLVGWNKDAGKKQMTVDRLRVGHFRVNRKFGEDKVAYETSRELDGDFCEGKIICRPGRIETVESWEAAWRRPSSTPSDWPPVVSRGSFQDGLIVMQGPGGERKLSCSVPLVSEVSLFFNPELPETLSGDQKGFARLDQTMIPRLEQRMRLAGEVAPPWGGFPLQTWLLSGRGLVPTHLVRDRENRPFFITGLLVSSALKSIS